MVEAESLSGCIFGLSHFVNIESTVNFIRGFGLLAPGVAFLLFTLHAIAPVFPYFILAGAAGVVFGFWEGAALAWSGALTGACCAFLLTRALGWEWLYKHLNRRYGLEVKRINPHLSFWAILLARIFPVVPTPLINTVSAVSGVSFGIFFLASALGKLPTALVYSGLGSHLYKSRDLAGTVVMLGIVFLAGWVGMKVVRQKGYF